MRSRGFNHLLHRAGLPVLLAALSLFALKAGALVAVGWNTQGTLVLHRALLAMENGSPVDTSMLARAGEAYRQALSYAPDDGRPYANLGDVYTAFGDAEAAARAYEEALRRAPHHRRAAFHLGQNMAVLGDEVAARAAWQQAGAAPYLADQAKALRTSDPVTALRYAERAVAVDPDDIAGYLALGQVLVAQKAYTTALTTYETALNRCPEAPEGYRELGLLLNRHFDRTSDAEALLAHALTLDPEDATARLELGRMMTAQGACFEAEGWLAPLLNQAGATSRSAQAHQTVARCFLDWDRPESALPYLERTATGEALSQKGVSVTTLLMLGEAYRGAGDCEAARTAYMQVLDLKPDHAGAQQALVELDEQGSWIEGSP